MTVFDKLLLLPFFQGVGQKELEDIASRIRLDFQNCASGDWIIRENERCLTLMLLMEGSMRVVAHSADRRYRIQERMEAPCAIEPERLFGLHQCVERDYQAMTDCTVLKLQKEDVLRLCAESLIFEINFLNTISTTSQRAKSAVWRVTPNSVPRKLAHFVASRSVSLAGEKTLCIRLSDLGRLIGESRLNVSRAIHAMENQQLLSFKRQTIVIPHLEKLLCTEE